MANDNDYDRFHVDLSGHSHCHKSLSDGLVVSQSRVITPLQPPTLATFLSWGISEGAGRIRLTRCKSTDFYRKKKKKSDFFSLWMNTRLIYRDIKRDSLREWSWGQGNKAAASDCNPMETVSSRRMKTKERFPIPEGNLVLGSQDLETTSATKGAYLRKFPSPPMLAFGLLPSGSWLALT